VFTMDAGCSNCFRWFHQKAILAPADVTVFVVEFVKIQRGGGRWREFLRILLLESQQRNIPYC
jgi:hypothetical protein